MSQRCGKSAPKSTGQRNSGNEAFGRTKVIDALRLYNQALQSAPHLSPEFFLALGNRSAALRDLNKLKECVEDIDRILEAQESSTIPTSTLERLRARRSEVLSQLHVEEEDDRATESAPQLFIGCNPSVPSLSKAVDVRFSKEKGRHLIANRKLAKGSVVIVEDPYAKVLLPHCALSHCHFCCRELPLNHLPFFVRKNAPREYGSIKLNFIHIVAGRRPNAKVIKKEEECTTCIEEVNFCNEQCRDEALLNFHSIECGNVEKLNNIGLGYLAVRLVLCSDVDQLIEYDLASDRVKSMQRVFGSSPADVYSSSDFRSVASLESHDDDGETASSEEVKLTAVKLTRFLRENGYFSSARLWPANMSIKQQEVVVVRALVGLVRRLICNAHAVTKVVDSLPYTTDETESQEVLDRNEVYIASGLFPTTSLANHSCIPNLFSSFVSGTTVVVRVTRDMEEGDELLNCYGPMFGRQPTKDRQEALLHQYGFVCKCNACTSPQCAQIERELTAFRCPLCSAAATVEAVDGKPLACCGKCHHNFAVNFTEIMALSESLDKLTDSADLPLARKELMLQQLTALESHLFRFNKRLGEMRDGVAHILALSGYDDEAISLLRKNLPAIEHHYGGESVELAEEIVKLCHHLRRRTAHGLTSTNSGSVLPTELRALVAKARAIFAAYYGSDSVKDRQLRELYPVEESA